MNCVYPCSINCMFHTKNKLLFLGCTPLIDAHAIKFQCNYLDLYKLTFKFILEIQSNQEVAACGGGSNLSNSQEIKNHYKHQVCVKHVHYWLVKNIADCTYWYCIFIGHREKILKITATLYSSICYFCLDLKLFLHSSNNSLFAVPANQEFVYINKRTCQSFDPAMSYLHYLLKMCQFDPGM